MRKLLIMIIIALTAIVTCIIFSPNSPREDWERFINGGVKATPAPKGTPRKLTPEEQREAMKNPKGRG